VTPGKIHEYLGMTIDYSIPEKVQMTMFDYIDNLLVEMPDDMGHGNAPSPKMS
jgi:hypothetical protein